MSETCRAQLSHSGIGWERIHGGAFHTSGHKSENVLMKHPSSLMLQGKDV